MTSTTTKAAEAATENFADLLAESFGEGTNIEGSVVRGFVIGMDSEAVIIDVGLKSEGRVPLKELAAPGQAPQVAIGDEIEVYVERMEDRNGQAVLSREKARREEAWGVLETSFEKQERVTGVIFGKVKGGFTVDLSGATAFLPGSQVDIRPVRDLGPLMGTPQPFQILKIDRRRGNIVVSRRAVLEESRAEARSELVSNLQEGQVLQGVVKNITDYGAFVDLGGVDGLLHVTDIAWQRISHPSEALQIGETVEVQVIRFNAETQRISLGMKQLMSDPWENVEGKFPIGAKMEGRVTNITDYGAFVELEAGVEGLVHVSEMDWTNKNVHPSKIVSLGDEVEVMVLDIDEERRRISLGIKQCKVNPWEAFSATHAKGEKVSGPIKSITDFGVFIGLDGGIDGLIHLSDLSWSEPGEVAVRNFKKGEDLEAVILAVDPERERISLGVKQLEEDPMGGFLSGTEKGAVVKGTVTEVEAKQATVDLGDGVLAVLKASELSRDRVEDARNVLNVGDEVEAKIANVDRKTRQISLSVRAMEEAEEKEALRNLNEASADEGEVGPTTIGELIKAQMEGRE